MRRAERRKASGAWARCNGIPAPGRLRGSARREITIDRHWLLTWTCYGQWLPGDRRGFVSFIDDENCGRVIHNTPKTPFDADIPALENYARSIMTGQPITLDVDDANAVIDQFRETSQIRHWQLEAASVMYNHAHVLIGVLGDPDPELLLETVKSWATRRLKRRRPVPPNGTFWTAKGSKRKLADDRAVLAGVIYVVRKQPNPLAICFDPRWQDAIDEYNRASRTP